MYCNNIALESKPIDWFAVVVPVSCRGGTQEISQRSILSGKYIFEVKKYFL